MTANAIDTPCNTPRIITYTGQRMAANTSSTPLHNLYDITSHAFTSPSPQLAADRHSRYLPTYLPTYVLTTLDRRLTGVCTMLREMTAPPPHPPNTTPPTPPLPPPNPTHTRSPHPASGPFEGLYLSIPLSFAHLISLIRGEEEEEEESVGKGFL